MIVIGEKISPHKPSYGSSIKDYFSVSQELHRPIMLNSYLRLCIYRGFPGSSAGKESTCSAGDSGSFPGSERLPGEGIGYPF